MAYCQECGAENDQGAQFCKECGSEMGESETTTEQIEHTHPGEEGIAWKHLIIVGIISFLPAIILAIVLPGAVSAIGFIIAIPTFTYLGYQRPNGKTAFGRISFWTAVSLFMSPLFMLIHTAVFAESQAEGQFETAGAAIGGTVLIIAAFVIGVPLGIVFYFLSKRYDIDD